MVFSLLSRIWTLPLRYGQGKNFYRWQVLLGAVSIVGLAVWIVAPWALWMSFGSVWTFGWLVPTAFVISILFAPAAQSSELTFEEAPEEDEPDDGWDAERELPVELVEWLEALNRGPSRRCRFAMVFNNWILGLVLAVLIMEQWWFLVVDAEQLAGLFGMVVGVILAFGQIVLLFRAADSRWGRRSIA